MVVSDAHEGLGRALRGVFPGSAWQRCQFHFSRNVSDKVPVRYRPGVRAELAEMFGSDTLERARERCRAIADEYRGLAEGAVRCLEDGFESAMTVMALPKGVRRYLRTNNHLERLNKELKRRSKVIGMFPNEASLVRMMGSVLIEQDGMRRRMRAAYGKDTYEAIMRSDAPARLATIAKEQHDLAQAG